MLSLVRFLLILIGLLLGTYARAAPRAYVTNGADDSVSVVDTETDESLCTIAVGRTPRGLAIRPGGTQVYVANFGEDTLSVIDTSDNTVIAVVHDLVNPQRVAFTPDGSRAYVTLGTLPGLVAILDVTTRDVVDTWEIGPYIPLAVAVSPDGMAVAVGARHSDDEAHPCRFSGACQMPVFVAPTSVNRGGTTPRFPDLVFDVAFHPTRNLLYVANGWDISAVDSPLMSYTIRQTQPREGGASIAMHPSGTFAYVQGNPPSTGRAIRVLDIDTNLVSRVIDTSTISGVNTVGDIAFTADGTRAYALSRAVRDGEDPDKLIVVDTGAHQALRSITVGRLANSVAIADADFAGGQPTCTPMLPSPTPTGTATVAPSCAGDCNGDHMVDEPELISCVDVSLGIPIPEACPQCDADGNDSTTVEDLVRAVRAALTTCP